MAWFGRAARAALIAYALIGFTSGSAQARLGLGEPLGERGTRSHQPVPATPTAPLGVRPLPGRGIARRAEALPVQIASGSAPLFDRLGRFLFRRPIISAWLGAFGGSLLLGSVLTGSGLVGFVSFWVLLAVLLPVAGVITVMRVARGMLNRFAPGMVSAAARIWGPAPLLLGGGAREAHVDRRDLQVFQLTLEGLQQSWSEGDMPSLASGTTPELQAGLTRQWEQLAARGERDRVEHVRLEQADLAEGWSEGDTDWATVTWRISAAEWRERSDGSVVEGDRGVRSVATEAWSFVRLAAGPGRSGGPWRLAAVQPAG